MFDKLNEISHQTGIFTFGGASFKKYGLDKKEYERLLKHLDILGFCKHIGSRRYSVPPLYQKRIEKE
jgi:hypothetical protein